MHLSQSSRSVSCVIRPLYPADCPDIQRKIEPSARKAAARLRFCGSAIWPTTPSTEQLVKPMCIGEGVTKRGFLAGVSSSWSCPATPPGLRRKTSMALLWSSSHNSIWRGLKNWREGGLKVGGEKVYKGEGGGLLKGGGLFKGGELFKRGGGGVWGGGDSEGVYSKRGGGGEVIQKEGGLKGL